MSLFHKITEEGHPFQKRTLYLLARCVELPFLRFMYKLLRGDLRRIGALRPVRTVVSFALTRPLARYGDSAKPIPYEQLLDHIDGVGGAIALGPCRCRISHKPCGHPLDTDIVIRTGTEAWLKAFPEEYRIIDRERARRVVSECHELGMFHMLFFHCPATGCAEYVICSCCVCGCVPLIINRELGQKNFPLFEGDWIAVTDAGKCSGRGDCVPVCPFGARSVENGGAVTRGCFGCGLCVNVCPEKAIAMRLKRNNNGEKL